MEGNIYLHEAISNPESFHVKFPLFLAGVDVGEGKEFGEDGETVLNKPFGSFADMRLHLLRDLMEMI
jgi:hypothetical protein